MGDQNTTSVQQELHHAFALHDFILNHLSRCKPARTERNIFSGALYDLSLEHAMSIAKLVDLGGYGSAATLIRPSYETLLRGMWAYYSATDGQISAIKGRNADFPDAKKLHSHVKRFAPQGVYSVLDVTNQVIPHTVRHGLTHGGLEQIHNRFDGTTIRCTFGDDVIVGIVRVSNAICVGAATCMTLQDGSKADDEAIFDEYFRIMYESSLEIRRRMHEFLAAQPEYAERAARIVS